MTTRTLPATARGADTPADPGHPKRARSRAAAGRHAATASHTGSPSPEDGPVAATGPVVQCPGLMALDIHRANAAFHALHDGHPASPAAARALAAAWCRFLAVVIPGVSDQSMDAVVCISAYAASRRRMDRDRALDEAERMRPRRP